MSGLYSMVRNFTWLGAGLTDHGKRWSVPPALTHTNSHGGADWLRSQDHFHQIRFVAVQPVEPGWPFFQRRDGRDQRPHLDGAGGEQGDAGRVLAVGGAGALEADLASDHRLQR